MTFSLLPDCLAARLPGTLQDLEEVVAVAEAASSLAAAADAVRRDAVLLPGAMRWLRRTRVAVETMRGWLKLYRRGGFEALYPKRRADLGRPRRMAAEVAEALVAIETEHPGYSARAFIDDATRVIPHAAFAFAALAAIEKGDGAEAGKLAPLIESTFRASYASITRAQEDW